MELSGGVPDAASGHGYAGYEQPSSYSPGPRPSSFKPTPRPPPGPPPGRAANGNSHPWQQGGSQAWKGKPSKNSKPAVESPNPSLDTPVVWIQTLDENSSLVLQGFPAVGPVMHHHSDLQHLLSSANNILYDLIGDECGDVELKHDPEWTDYPEVGEALTSLGFGEVALCVAVCPGRSIWAVGLASKQKHRQQAARLSLCVALAANADSLNDVAKHDGFLQLCQSAGINTEDVVSAPAAQKASSSWSGGRPKKKPKTYETEDEPFAESVQTAPEEEALLAEQAELEQEEALLAEKADFEQQVIAQEAEAEEAWQPKAKEKKPYVPEVAMDRDTALWTRLLEDIPEQLVAMSPEILVLASDGSGRKGLYSQADAVVAKLIGDNHQEEVEYVDDSDWSLFPAVGSALKTLGEKEECFVLASCPSRCLCAVGVGMKGKNRWAAAKVAIAVQVALQQVEIGEDLPDLSEFQAFADFIEEARAAKDFASL